LCCLTVVALPLGKNQFAVQLNANANNNNNNNDNNNQPAVHPGMH
jgi:hypothetical protein